MTGRGVVIQILVGGTFLAAATLAVLAVRAEGDPPAPDRSRSREAAAATMDAERAAGTRFPPNDAEPLGGSCADSSRPGTDTVTVTKTERLALWEEAWRRDQAYLAGLHPTDAARERARRLSARATIEAGPESEQEVVEYVEIWSPDESCGTPPPGTPATAPGWSEDR